jgi:acetyl-CoA acetyltransferase
VLRRPPDCVAKALAYQDISSFRNAVRQDVSAHKKCEVIFARALSQSSGYGPEDIDVLELPDNSSWHYLVYLETCGFCKEGEADKMLRDDETKIGGKLPVNPSGGFSSHGEALSAQALWQVMNITKLDGTCDNSFS